VSDSTAELRTALYPCGAVATPASFRARATLVRNFDFAQSHDVAQHLDMAARTIERLSEIAEERASEIGRLKALIDAPELVDFWKGVQIEQGAPGRALGRGP
jgi:hypothetical protein